MVRTGLQSRNLSSHRIGDGFGGSGQGGGREGPVRRAAGWVQTWQCCGEPTVGRPHLGPVPPAPPRLPTCLRQDRAADSSLSPRSLGWAQVQGRDLYSVNYWCPSHSCVAQHNGILLFLSSLILEAKAKCFNFTLFLT